VITICAGAADVTGQEAKFVDVKGIQLTGAGSGCI
jgi:hypothetical protein